MKTLKQLLLEAEAQAQEKEPEKKEPAKKEPPKPGQQAQKPQAQAPQRRASDRQVSVYDRLDQSNPANPVMFTTRQGPATVYKDMNGWYIVKVGKTTFPASPSAVLKSENELDDWFRSTGAMSMGS